MTANRFKKDFVALASPSGGGKTTLCNMLLAKYRDTCLSVSYTTRSPRGTEKNGVEYNFISESEFKELISKGGLAEWAKVHGNYYGTGKDFLMQMSGKGKVVLLDVDVQGVEQIKKYYPDRTLSIFILPPSLREFEERLRARKTESEEKIRARLDAAKLELKHAEHFDRKLTNVDLHQTFEELCEIVEGDVGLVQ